jgi:hypothetical protein
LAACTTTSSCSCNHFASQFGNQAFQSLCQTSIGIVTVFINPDEVIDSLVMPNKLLNGSYQRPDISPGLLGPNPFSNAT